MVTLTARSTRSTQAGRAPLGLAGLGALLGTLGIALLPTVGALGYPSALLASPLYALFGIRLALRQLPRERELRARSLRALLARALRRGALVWSVGLGILAASGLAQGSRDLAFGAACFALGPGLALLVGWTCGLVAGLLTTGRLLRAALAVAPLLLSLALSLWRLYRDPAVFAFDPFFGAFSGGIYDLDFELGGTYLFYRGCNLAACLAVLVLVGRAHDFERGRFEPNGLPARPTVSAAALAVLAAVLAVAARPERFGLHQTAANLADVLGGTRATEHFELHYRPGSANARELDAIADELELWWTLLAEELSASPEPPVRVFLFDTPLEKRELLGVGAAEVAAPWRRHIYLHYRPDPHPVIPHELAHVFGAAFGDPVFGLALDPPRVDAGLIEGFAEALAGIPREHLSVHERAAILARLELAPALEELFGWGFWAAPPARAYDAAGSFCRCILERVGARAHERLYATGGDFEAVLGRPLAELEAEWRAFLAARPVEAADVERERLRFERRSLFERPHAYTVARKQRRIERALRSGELERARALQGEIAALEPELPEHRLALARLLGAAARFGEALELARPIAADETQPALVRAAAAELVGDVSLALGELEDARRAYETALDRPLFDSERRVLELKRRASLDPSRAGAWLRYLLPFDLEADADALARRRLAAALALRELPGERALASYLAALQHAALWQLEPARALLAEAFELDDWSLPGFERAARELLLRVAARLGELDTAAATLALLRQAERGPGDRRRHAIWERRLAFLRAR